VDLSDDPVSRAVAVLGGAGAPLPTVGDEPVFAEPWEGRAFAMAIDVVDRVGGSWEAFRTRLVAAIAEDPARPYDASWVVALERLVLETAAVTEADLDRARNGAAAYRYDEQGVGDVEVFPIRAQPVVVVDLLTETVRQLPPAAEPDDVPTPADRCRHVELYRRWSDGAPRSWGLRLFDGDDGALVDIALPQPRLDDDDRPLDPPDWSRLACWDDLRRRVLDLTPDPADRLAGP
jgi:hypothetical protein